MIAGAAKRPMSKDDATRGRRFVLGLSAIAVGVLIALSLGELTVRLFVPQFKWERYDRAKDWVADQEVGWANKPHRIVTNRFDGSSPVTFRTNKDGLRPFSVTPERDVNRKRIMIFGDSTAVGRAVPEATSIHRQLQQQLVQRGIDAQVINAGVEGYATDQALLLLQRLLPQYRPDVVVHVVCTNDFGGNAVDHAYGMRKPVFRLSPDEQLTLTRPGAEAVITVGRKGPIEWLQYSALYRVVQPYLLTIRAQLGGWNERNLIGLSEEIYYRPDATKKIDWKLFSALVREMREASRIHESQFLFYLHPDLAAVWDPYIQDVVARLGKRGKAYDVYAIERRLAAIGHAHDIQFVPMIDYFRARQNQGPFHLLPRDPHSNSSGFQLTAEVLAKHIVDMGLLK